MSRPEPLEVVRCPDCSGTGRQIVEGRTLVGAGRPDSLCRGTGHVEVFRWGAQADRQAHRLIVTTERCLCGLRIPQAKGMSPAGHDCPECLIMLGRLTPTASERARWYLDVEPPP